jgi:hypothetical protein
VDRLTNIREALLHELSGSHARLRFINTRLILSVNVNLYEESRSEEIAAARFRSALQTLNKMGLLLKYGEVRRGA